MIKAAVFFSIGLILLIFGGDWFVDGATGIAKRFQLPELLIGATIVAIGTTLPEVMVSASGALQGHSQIAYGNALGSIICNTALISAVSVALAPSKVEKKTIVLPFIFFFAAAGIYSWAAYGDGYFSRFEGILLLIAFVLCMFTEVREAMKEKNETAKKEDNDEEIPLWKDLLLLVIGAAAIALGADYLVDNGTIIAKGMGVPESVIALTFVSLGTSLPELITAITSARKGHGLLSLGNIIGANFLNMTLVSGVSITLCPFAVPAEKLLFGMNASFVIDIPLVMIVMLILTVPPLIRGRLYRWQGILLLFIYAAYCIFQFAS